jgi:hypothetical protein
MDISVFHLEISKWKAALDSTLKPSSKRNTSQKSTGNPPLKTSECLIEKLLDIEAKLKEKHITKINGQPTLEDIRMLD